MVKDSIRYAIEKGAELVAAFDMNPAVLGKDAAAEIAGDGYPSTGVRISPADHADENSRRAEAGCLYYCHQKYHRRTRRNLHPLRKTWHQRHYYLRRSAVSVEFLSCTHTQIR